MPAVARPRIRTSPTSRLRPADERGIRDLLTAAFARDAHGGFSWDDWLHAMGGMHFIQELDGAMIGHASVVKRVLEIDGRPARTGYVEAVAILPALQGRGFGSALMREVNAHVVEQYELGALGTGSQPFYERLGWQVWQGPTGVRVDGGVRPTPDEDGYILVLPTPTSPAFRLTDPISCDWRSGDVW